jgi:hypothetical protein
VPEEKSRAEVVFEEYLTGQSITWEYETLAGHRKPDYLIPHNDGKCIVEVKQIEDPNPRPTEGFNPYRFVRAKIDRARKQFREYKNLPCALAVYSESMFGPYEPSILLSAAFGPGYQQAGRDYSKLDPNPSFYRFLKQSELPEDKHFLADAMLSPAANTTFSAIVMITRFRIRKLDLEVWKRRYAQQEADQPIENQFDLLNELAPTLGQSRHVEETIRVITIENCHRRLPFPEDLFRGRFDQRWGWKDGCCGPIWVGDSLRALYEQEGVPFYML